MTELIKELKLKQGMSTAYHPQTNGLTKRFNKTLLEMLSMFVTGHHQDWNEYLPYIIHTYQTSLNASTNEKLKNTMIGLGIKDWRKLKKLDMIMIMR